MPRGYKKVGSIGDRLKALDFLRSICHRTSDGYSEYLPGWSDKKVARKVSGNFSTAVIRHLRVEYIGKSRVHLARHSNRVVAAQLAHSNPLTPPAREAELGIAARITLLERRLARLEDTLIDEAIKGMSLNDTNRH
jgi:hypothetical protein